MHTRCSGLQLKMHTHILYIVADDRLVGTQKYQRSPSSKMHTFYSGIPMQCA